MHLMLLFYTDYYMHTTIYRLLYTGCLQLSDSAHPEAQCLNTGLLLCLDMPVCVGTIRWSFLFLTPPLLPKQNGHNTLNISSLTDNIVATGHDSLLCSKQ